MKTLRETYTLLGQVGQVDVYDVALDLWDDALKTLDTGSRSFSQATGTPAPDDFSADTDFLMDEYQLPTDPQAPGYVAGKEGWRRRVYHDGGGGVTFDDEEPDTCDLALTGAQGFAPTSRGGFGYIQLQLTSSATSVRVVVRSDPGGQQVADLTRAPGVIRVVNLLAGGYLLAGSDANGCSLPQVPVTIPPYQKAGCTIDGATNYDPDATDDDGTCVFAPAEWYAVGGLQPLPVALPVALSLTDTQGARRQNLYAEVELFSAGQATAFASFRRTIRTATDTVDAAPYLRSQLLTQLRYSVVSGPQRDADAGLVFHYRYRGVDSTGPGPWVDRPLPRYAVLAAPDATDSNLLGYTASSASPARPLSAFPVPTQFVGLPLEVTLLVPDLSGPLFCQLRYLDALRQELEIRTVAIPPAERGGVVRVALPATPLPCAAFVVAALVDEDHNYDGTCASGSTTPTLPPGYLQLPGRLKLG